jgi:hypothetical protein
MASVSGKCDADFIDTSRFADDFDVHGRAADFAILDGRVIALGCVSHRGDDFAAVRALNLDFDEHGRFLTELTELTTEKGEAL